MNAIVDKIKLFFKKNWHWVFFSVFVFFSLSFLIFQRGFWLYLDLSWWPKNQAENTIILKQIINSWENFNLSYFGYDIFFNNFQRLISLIYIWALNYVFGGEVGQIIFYCIAFFIAFFFSVKLLKLINSNQYKSLSLFFCFNPVSIYLISQGTVFLSYSFIPLFLYSAYKLLISFKYKYLLLNIISLFFIFTYLRIVGMIGMFMVLLVLFYVKEIFLLIKRMALKEKIIALLLYIFLFSGLFLGMFFIQHDETLSQNNYKTSTLLLYADDFYYKFKEQKHFFDNISLNQITNNFTQEYLFFNTLLSLILFCFIIYLFIRSTNKSKGLYFSWFGIIFCFTLLVLAKFVDIKIFLLIFAKILPFLSLNILWLKILLLVFLISFLALIKNIHKLLNIFLLLFIVCSVIPTLQWKDDIKLLKIKEFDEFYQDHIGNKPLLLYPINFEAFLHQKMYPYPLAKYYNSIFHPLFSNNARLLGDKHIKLHKAYNNKIENSFLFGLKDIFVFKDLSITKHGQFDYYKTMDYQQKGKEYYKKFISDTKLEIVSNNFNFTHFVYKNFNRFNFDIYSPNKIIESEINDFQNKNVSTKEKAIMINSWEILNMERNFLSLIYQATHNSVEISSKNSLLNATKYYVKISNFDKNLPFLIHLNQSFHPRWKVYFIDKSFWDEKTCQNEWEEFSITQNKKCIYKSNLLEYGDLRLLSKKYLKEENHFQGNFIGNTFLITPEDIPNEYRNNDELYIIIYFEKQIYYIITLTILGLILLFLIVMTIIEEIKLKRLKNENTK